MLGYEVNPGATSIKANELVDKDTGAFGGKSLFVIVRVKNPACCKDHLSERRQETDFASTRAL